MQLQAIASGLMALAAGLASETYHRTQLHIDQAWSVTQGRPEVTVAVLDTGANIYVTPIREAISLNAGESGNGRETDGEDNDGNGYIDDVYGVNTLKGFADPMDFSGLGTFDVSLIASKDYGLAPGVRVIPIAVCDVAGTCSVDSVVRGIQYAVQRGASVISIATGGVLNEVSQPACDAIRAAGVPVIGVAGGEGRNLSDPSSDQKLFPADCDAENLIVATASGPQGELAPFANYGATRVHVAAPGVQVPGVNHHGFPVHYTGTNVAGTATAAVAALVKSAHPEYTTTQIKRALIQAADPVAALQGKVQSGGTLNAWKAVSEVAPTF